MNLIIQEIFGFHAPKTFLIRRLERFTKKNANFFAPIEDPARVHDGIGDRFSQDY